MDYEKLVGKTWGTNPTMISFFKSKDFKKIVQSLKEESLHSRENIFPKGEEIFLPFRLCPMDEVMVVFLGVNPYFTDRKWSDGILFSAPSLTGTAIPKVLATVFRGVADNYDTKLKNRSLDLSRWVRQGALFLPLDLTMVQGKKGAHISLWEPFLRAVISALQSTCPGVIYVLLGQDALRIKERLDPSSSDVICVEHPSKAVSLNRNWKHKNVFTYLDRVTNLIFNRKINWL
jgi:uracil DNA glycosylase